MEQAPDPDLFLELLGEVTETKDRVEADLGGLAAILDEALEDEDRLAGAHVSEGLEDEDLLRLARRLLQHSLQLLHNTQERGKQKNIYKSLG